MTAPARESTAVARIEAHHCPWCRCRIERGDAVERVGHEWLHRTCAADFDAAQSDAPLVFGTRYEDEQRRGAK